MIADVDGSDTRLKHREKELLHRARLRSQQDPELGYLLLMAVPSNIFLKTG